MAVLGFGGSFRDVREWYTRIAVLERRVCLMQARSGQPMSTAFLVAPDVIMTTSHTMGLAPPSPDWAADYTARFGFAISPFTGTVIEGTQHEIARNDWLVSYSPVRDLDVALIRLAEKVGETETDGTQRGWVDLCEANHQPLPGTAVAIMQHPEGGPLKIAMSTDAVIRLDPNLQRLFYRTDTLPGASGAPCFDIDWRFLAMHR